MSRQKGSALLLALLIMALITSIVVVSGDYLQRSLLRNQMLEWQTEAKWALLGNEALIMSKLAGQMPLSYAVYRPGKINDMTIEYRLRDLNSCFNLNSLYYGVQREETTPDENHADGKANVKQKAELPPEAKKKTKAANEQQAKAPRSVAIFTHLVKEVTGLDKGAAERLTRSVVEWINPAPAATGVDGKAAAKNTLNLMMDSSELRIIPGITLIHYQQLKPWICVLPETSLKININALDEASAPLLSALTEGELPVSKAKALIQRRPPQGWDKPDAIIDWLTDNKQPSAKNIKSLLTLSGNYFLLSQWATREEQHYALHSLIRYDEKTIHIKQRKYGISEIN
ncbi:MAG: type II secretion system minor pseudopilin GspK [Pantoea sp.]|nr:type II secretion system minor pseudopilin GspK [Pantoea sp.]